MQKAGLVIILSMLLIGCQEPTTTRNTVHPIDPPVDPVDPAFWFGEIYNELITREQEGTIVEANNQVVCNAINAKWGANTVTPVSGTATQTANCEYLLKMIDKANRGRTTFGISSFATEQDVDMIAVNDAVNRLWVPGSKFVAVSNKNNLAYSTDGISWTQITVSGSWSGITYGNGKFVAVGNSSRNNNNLAYSPDGINWIPNPINGVWNGVTYGKDKFVAVGSDGIIAYSTDGSSWIQTTVGSNRWTSIIYGNGMFVAVGSNIRAYSTDGIKWTQIKASGGWAGVTYGNGKFVAVGSSGIIAYSIDGISWTQITASGNWTSVTYGNGVFVTGNNGSGKVAYSTDGISWETAPINIYYLSDITYGNGKFVAVGFSGVIAYSTDGINWTQITVSGDWAGVICGGE